MKESDRKKYEKPARRMARRAVMTLALLLTAATASAQVFVGGFITSTNSRRPLTNSIHLQGYAYKPESESESLEVKIKFYQNAHSYETSDGTLIFEEVIQANQPAPQGYEGYLSVSGDHFLILQFPITSV